MTPPYPVKVVLCDFGFPLCGVVSAWLCHCFGVVVVGTDRLKALSVVEWSVVCCHVSPLSVGVHMFWLVLSHSGIVHVVGCGVSVKWVVGHGVLLSRVVGHVVGVVSLYWPCSVWLSKLRVMPLAPFLGAGFPRCGWAAIPTVRSCRIRLGFVSRLRRSSGVRVQCR